MGRVRSAAIAAAPRLDKAVIQAALKRHFFLRIHMAVILGGTFATALAVTNLLMFVHFNNLAWRYGIAITAAFAGFIVFVRFWLGYIGFCATRARRSSSDGGDWFNGINFSSGGSIDFGGSMPSFGGGGGKFGGGGATGSWGDSDSSVQTPLMSAVTPSKGGSSGGSGFSLPDCDDLGLIILVVVLVLAIAAAAFYLIYAAPAILGEAAFQAALTASLARQTKKMGTTSWVGSLIRSTILPFLAILAIGVTLGWYAQKHCPSATRLHDAVACAQR